jgi:integrase
MSRRSPIKLDADLGLRLYAPTPTNPKYRLTYVDPMTGRRHQPTRHLADEADALWDETVAYLRAARHAAPLVDGRRRTGVTVDDVFDALVVRWQDDERSPRYINNRLGNYDYRIRPVCGHLTVREWGRSTDACREVLRRARVDGLARSSVQDLGAVMSRLRTLAWEKRWLARDADPMLGVRYSASATEQAQTVDFVHEADRPTFEAVDALMVAYAELAEETGIFWLPERALTGAQAALRPGERDALRLRDLDPDRCTVRVERATLWLPNGGGLVYKPPKNGKRRHVIVAGSAMERLVAVADRRRDDGAGPDDLLFADPECPDQPLSESKTRRLHIAAALAADWPAIEVRRDPDARRHLGPDLRPRHSNRSLRHHAASYMFHKMGYDWACVARYMGHPNQAFTMSRYVRSGSDADERNIELARNL